jgi:hypothetical protein
MTEACIPNIGPRQRNRRLFGGFLFAAMTVGVAAALLWFDAPQPWRLLVFLPAWMSAIGFFQFSEQTCVALAARRLRNMDSGDEEVTDLIQLARMRAQSRRVHIRAAVSAIAIAALFTLLPL